MTLPQLGFDGVDRSGSPKPDGSDFATAEAYVPGAPSSPLCCGFCARVSWCANVEAITHRPSGTRPTRPAGRQRFAIRAFGSVPVFARQLWLSQSGQYAADSAEEPDHALAEPGGQGD